jgi:hypothetical protein
MPSIWALNSTEMRAIAVKVGHHYDLALFFDFATATSRHVLILIKVKKVLRG